MSNALTTELWDQAEPRRALTSFSLQRVLVGLAIFSLFRQFTSQTDHYIFITIYLSLFIYILNVGLCTLAWRCVIHDEID